MMSIEVKHPVCHFTFDEVIAILAYYNRTINNVDVDVNCIKEWIRSQAHLTQMPDDRLILNVLIRNKFAIEKTKQNIDYYYSIRSILPELYADQFPSNANIQTVRKFGRAFALPKLVKLSRIVFFIVDEMHHKLDGYNFLAKIFMDMDALLYCNFSSNFDFIVDLSETNLAFWRIWTPVILKIHTSVTKKVYSNRSRALRIIGLPKTGQIATKAIVSCLPEKIQKRVTFHVNGKEMANLYPKDQLPLEYGGEGASYRELSAQFDDMVNECEEYFRNLQNFQVDPKLRPNKLENDEFLGYYGNFRTLDVD